LLLPLNPSHPIILIHLKLPLQNKTIRLQNVCFAFLLRARSSLFPADISSHAKNALSTWSNLVLVAKSLSLNSLLFHPLLSSLIVIPRAIQMHRIRLFRPLLPLLPLTSGENVKPRVGFVPSAASVCVHPFKIAFLTHHCIIAYTSLLRITTAPPPPLPPLQEGEVAVEKEQEPNPINETQQAGTSAQPITEQSGNNTESINERSSGGLLGGAFNIRPSFLRGLASLRGTSAVITTDVESRAGLERVGA